MSYILDIIIVVSLVLFLLFGLIKNYKRTLFELGFFIIIYCVFYFALGKTVINSVNINELGEDFTKALNDLINSFKSINEQIKELNNSQEGLSLPLIPDTYLNEDFYIGFILSIANQIVFIGYALVSFILSVILGSITYAIVFRKKNADPEYKKKKKSFKIRSIGMGVNLILGVITTSLVMSPFVLTCNSVSNLSNDLNAIINNNKIEEVFNKIDSYKGTVEDVSTKFDSISGKLDNIVNTLSTYDESLSDLNEKIVTFKTEFYTYYDLIQDIVENPGKLNSYEIDAAEEICNEMKDKKAEFDSTINDFNDNYETFKENYDSALNYQNDMKEYKTKIDDIKKTINDINTDSLNTSDIEKMLDQVNEYVPQLKIFNFMIIDLKFSEVNYNGTTYNYINSISDINEFITSYIDSLYNTIEPYFSQIDEQIENFNSSYNDIDSQLDDIQNTIEESNYSQEIEDANEKISDYQSQFNDVKDEIDDLDSRRK